MDVINLISIPLLDCINLVSIPLLGNLTYLDRRGCNKLIFFPLINSRNEIVRIK